MEVFFSGQSIEWNVDWTNVRIQSGATAIVFNLTLHLFFKLKKIIIGMPCLLMIANEEKLVGIILRNGTLIGATIT